jgi:kinesin family protein 4/21/27
MPPREDLKSLSILESDGVMSPDSTKTSSFASVGLAADYADDEDACIKVAVRVRPFLPFEAGNKSVVNVLPNNGIEIERHDHNAGMGGNNFTFDATYPPSTTQNIVFKRSILPLVQACLEGYNATVIAYGQTGSGKTHSILGETQAPGKDLDPVMDTSEAGVIPRALRSLFLALKSFTPSDESQVFSYDVKVQFIELYGEDIRDLLQTSNDPPKLSIRDGRNGSEPEIINITEVQVENAEQALLCLTRGSLRRVTRATQMNAESSRSHAIMTVLIQQKLVTKMGETEEVSTKDSKFHFVDLAGSERIKRTGATGQGLKEGVNINKGLLVLGNVISALASQSDGKKGKDNFVPYRDSKLTRLLRGSLGGNHKTLMVACVSPSGSNTEESLNTLRYANRAKNIQNKATVNMDAGSKMIAELREQLKAIAIELLRVRSFVGPDVVLDTDDSIFTEEVLKAIAGGAEVNLKGTKSSKKTTGSGETVTTDAETTTTAPSTVANTEAPGTVTSPKSEGSAAPKRTSKRASKLTKEKESTVSEAPSELSDVPMDSAMASKLEKANKEIEKLRKALEKSDDRVLETRRQLEWAQEELKMTKDELLAMADDRDDSTDSGVSALTDDAEIPRLSQDTYETVKSIYEEKLIQMTLELKEREEERENIAMTLYRHESDAQRLYYVKSTLTEDLSRKEQQINDLKTELREMATLTIVTTPTPQNESHFRRLRFGAAKRLASNASVSMSGYYTEKLNKIERHIKLREEECSNLGLELQKLEADSQIFIDLAQDLSDRLKEKDESMAKNSMNKNTQQKLDKLNVVIDKDKEERDQLVAELKRLREDSETFAALVKALTEERSTKLEHVEKYKRRHSELASSVGMTSPYASQDNGASSGDDCDDDASVSSAWSHMSMDSVGTAITQQPSQSISKIEYDQKVSQLEADITKHEDDRIYILSDLEKLEADSQAFNELSNSLKQKLRSKEDQIVTLKKDLDEFSERLKKQEKELADLAKHDDDEYTNGRGEKVSIR